jgi:isocitrate dehydrogenase
MFALRSSTKYLFRSNTFAKTAGNAAIRQLANKAKIIYTETDEAPALATYSLLPVVKKFTGMAGIDVELSDISLAGRIIATFPEKLTPEQRQRDELSELGLLCNKPEANIIKLPNVSASVPQLVSAIQELRAKGYDLPLYVQDPKTEADRINKEKYAKVLGSAVNPVLREGNSDRRVAPPVKKYAQKNPHKMGAWSSSSKAHVAHMTHGDFFETERSIIVPEATKVKIEFESNGKKTVLKDNLSLQAGEVFDAAVMHVADLREYYEREMQDALDNNILLSLHLKATMMKVSDPVMFGHAVTVFFKDAFTKHAELFKTLGVNPGNGLKDVLAKVATLPDDKRKEVEKDINDCYNKRPWLAMVNSAKGITNLHVPSDVIVDASMPCVIRDSGMMWNKDDQLETTKCLIPDRCYATFYQEVINFVKQNGQFDVSTMGNVANVGLMAQKAEEYGSHDKTFIIPSQGVVRVIDTKTNNVVFEHQVAEGDIWRACQTKDAPIRDWVRLAVSRARATGSPAIFWLDARRAHDASIIQKVNQYLKEHDTNGLDISIKDPVSAVRATMERAKNRLDTISVTGNVLRDYLTDLFPILELGTSAKMLSIVPLLNGGGLFETGAGGSAPKHVEQFLKEGHLRWDSLGEYLALAVSLEHLGTTQKNQRAILLGQALNEAIGRLLDNQKSPSRKVNEIDNRASNFYIALYWAEAMAAKDPAYSELARKLQSGRAAIVQELKASQGKPVDVGGYYKFDPAKAAREMRPSATFNAAIDN